MKNITLLLFMFFSMTAIGQQDEKAEKILDQIAEKNKSSETITAEFSVNYRNLQSEGNSTTTKGKIIMKGEKYKLDIRNSVIFYNGKTMWNYLKEVNEVNISEPVQDPEEQDILNHPNQIFNIYKQDFKYKYLGTEAENGKNLYKIDLYPKNLEKDYSRIRLLVQQNSYNIHSAEIYGKDGSRITLTVDKILFDQSVGDSTFLFDKSDYPDVEVIDMRF